MFGHWIGIIFNFVTDINRRLDWDHIRQVDGLISIIRSKIETSQATFTYHSIRLFHVYGFTVNETVVHVLFSCIDIVIYREQCSIFTATTTFDKTSCPYTLYRYKAIVCPCERGLTLNIIFQKSHSALKQLNSQAAHYVNFIVVGNELNILCIHNPALFSLHNL